MLHALPCESFGLGLAAEPSLERKDGLSEDDLEAGKDACARRGVKATQLRGGTSTSGGYKWGSMGDTWEIVRENACDYTSCGPCVHASPRTLDDGLAEHDDNDDACSPKEVERGVWSWEAGGGARQGRSVRGADRWGRVGLLLTGVERGGEHAS